MRMSDWSSDVCSSDLSGSGKSMLAHATIVLLPPPIHRRSGRIGLLDEDLTAMSPRAWRAKRGREMAMIFQEPMTSLNPVMRIGTQIEEVLRRRRGLPSAVARRLAIGLLERVEIPSAERQLNSLIGRAACWGRVV